MTFIRGEYPFVYCSGKHHGKRTLIWVDFLKGQFKSFISSEVYYLLSIHCYFPLTYVKLQMYFLIWIIESFSPQRPLMVFHWRLYNKSRQVSRTLLSILVDLDGALVWTASTCSIISKSFSPWTNPLLTVLRAPITVDIMTTFILHSFFSSLARSMYLSFFSYSFNFTRWFTGIAKSKIL